MLRFSNDIRQNGSNKKNRIRGDTMRTLLNIKVKVYSVTKMDNELEQKTEYFVFTVKKFKEA